MIYGEKTFYFSLLVISAIFLLNSCRNEDYLLQQKKAEDLRFSSFLSKDGKPVNYGNAFESLMKRYDTLHRTNTSGINNPVMKNLSASANKTTLAFKQTGSYVEFKVRSQLITEENGDKWMVFPRVEGNTVISLITGALASKGTSVVYREVDKETNLYKNNILAFQQALTRYQNKTKKITTLALQASVKAYAGTNGDFDPCEDPNLYPTDQAKEYCKMRYQEIEPVDLYKYRPYIPLGPGWTNDIGGGDPNGCPQYQDCNNGLPDTPETTEVIDTKTECGIAKANNKEAKKLINKEDVKKQKEEMLKDIKTDKNEKGFSFGKDKDGKYKTTDLKNSTTGNSVGIQATDSNIKLEAGVHSHTTDLFACFSVGDFYAFNTATKANSDFKYFYVFSEKSGYVMTITDEEKFKKFSEKYPTSDYFDPATVDWKKGTAIYNAFDDAYQQFITSGVEDDTAFAYATAAVMKKYDMGISLSELDRGDFKSIFVNEKQFNVPIGLGLSIPISTYQATDDCNY
ncbi:MAG: hypothetical protein LBE39_11850 [Flavobacteriaceae bacterium]|jgi:hypothetical protein|nr:hypothetical protein [Flavobacteriaceae bacterium]